MRYLRETMQVNHPNHENSVRLRVTRRAGGHAMEVQMHEIKCPKCGSVFQVDGSSYEQIVAQIRTAEFEQSLREREAQWVERQKQTEENLRLQREMAQQASESAHRAALEERDRQVERLRVELSHAKQTAETETERAVRSAKDTLSGELEKLRRQITEKEHEAERLQAQLAQAGNEQKLAVMQAVQAKDGELAKRDLTISDLRGKLENQLSQAQIRESETKAQHEHELKAKDEQIAFYKDLKAKQSTKMVGETLEQHCQTKFNEIRATAFPNAYFEKDNDARTGSKGDFIFREQQDGIEFLSIMFEMKNETESNSVKHRNEDFFKELDKDRREKNCEYAILVSLLEPDSELYNNGIVDVSYRYPKMYVIRPQFFIPVITMLRNTAMNGLALRRELIEVQNRQLDVQNFEANMNDFKEKFSSNYRIASQKFNTAIEEIDKTIQHLQKVRDALTSSERQLRLANDKAESLSIKKLTKNAPSVRALFEGTAEELKQEATK